MNRQGLLVFGRERGNKGLKKEEKKKRKIVAVRAKRGVNGQDALDAVL